MRPLADSRWRPRRRALDCERSRRAIAFYREVVGLQLAHVIAARGAALARGVRVNVISPGPVDTPTFDRMGIPGEEPRQTKEQITQLTPRKRFAQPGEIADEVLYLSSHESRFIIGTDLVIDGGRIQL